MSRTYVVTTEPAAEPLTLDELKTRLRILSCDFDTELSQILTTSRRIVEEDARRKFVTQTVKLYLDEFPVDNEIEINYAPVSSITSVEYYDQNGTLTTFASSNYWANLIESPPEVQLRQSKTWPTTELERPNSVIITFVAGYGAASAVPAAAKLAIVEYARSIWNNCEGRTAQYNRLMSSLQWTAYHEVRD